MLRVVYLVKEFTVKNYISPEDLGLKNTLQTNFIDF